VSWRSSARRPTATGQASELTSDAMNSRQPILADLDPTPLPPVVADVLDQLAKGLDGSVPKEKLHKNLLPCTCC